MVLTVNEWYCITLYTSAGGRLSGLQDEQGLLFRGRAGQMFRGPRPVRGANAHGAEPCIAVVQFSLLSHLMRCMISQQTEATANYLLLLKKEKTKKKEKTLAVLWWLRGFSTIFSPSRLLLLSAWAEINIFKRCTLWECLFCAVMRWILCMEVVYKENKQTSKRLTWYPVLKGYVVLESRPPRWSTEPAASARPVVSLRCWLSSMLLLFFFCFCYLQVLFVSGRALARELWLKTCTARNCQILLKNRRLAHILVIARFSFAALTCMFRWCHYPVRSWKTCLE